MQYTIYTEPPKDFCPTVQGAGCYCACNGKLLYLKRLPSKSQGGTWCEPGGKLEKGESPRAAVIREVREEVGLNIDDEGLEEIGKLYIRLSHVEYVFHMFCKSFLSFPKIMLGYDEHEEARWITAEEAMQMPLIAGGKESLELYLQHIEQRKNR